MYQAKVFLKWTFFFALVYRAKLLWIPIIALGQKVDTVHGFTRACIVTPFLSKVRAVVIVNLTEEKHWNGISQNVLLFFGGGDNYSIPSKSLRSTPASSSSSTRCWMCMTPWLVWWVLWAGWPRSWFGLWLRKDGWCTWPLDFPLLVGTRVDYNVKMVAF